MNPTEDMQALIASLHALESPSTISWWPLAWGWWLTGIVLIAAATTIYRLLRARRARRRWRQTATARLNQLERRAASCSEPESHALLCDLSVLLRQVALLQHPRGGVARLHGDAWLGMLDRLGGTTEFSAGAGRCLKDAPYRKVAVEQTQLQRTLALSKQLLNRCADPQRQVPIEESQRA